MILITCFIGCSSVADTILPTNDEVLIYELPFDLTFLRTMEALDSHPDWELEETEKEKGIIRVRNIAFSSLIDADQRLISFSVKRIGREETSISIVVYSQHVFGGDDLLALVADELSKEL